MHVEGMQKTFKFCVSTGEGDDWQSSAENSLDPESSDVVGESITDTAASKGVVNE